MDPGAPPPEGASVPPTDVVWAILSWLDVPGGWEDAADEMWPEENASDWRELVTAMVHALERAGREPLTKPLPLWTPAELLKRGHTAFAVAKYGRGDVPRSDRLMHLAARCGNLSVIRSAYRPGNLHEPLVDAAEGGHLEALRLLHDLGETRYNEAMLVAACAGNLAIVEQLYDWGGRAFNALPHAAKNGHADVVKALLDWGICGERGIYESTKLAAKNGHEAVCGHLINWASASSERYVAHMGHG